MKNPVLSMVELLGDVLEEALESGWEIEVLRLSKRVGSTTVRITFDTAGERRVS